MEEEKKAPPRLVLVNRRYAYPGPRELFSMERAPSIVERPDHSPARARKKASCRFERLGASPAAVTALMRMNSQIDISAASIADGAGARPDHSISGS